MVNGTRDYNNLQQIGAEQDLSIVTEPSQSLDVAGDNDETVWDNNNWAKYNGYYRQNQGGSKAAITQYATWIVGRGFTTDEATKKRLEKIRGNGTDTFKGILKNALRVKKVGGDSFCEVITSDNKAPTANGRNIINLKPMNPGTTRIIANEAGITIGYEQTKEGETDGKRLETWQVFHLSNDREGSEIHGISVYEGSTKMLDRIQQLDEDMTIVYHRFVMPFLIFKAKTDKPAELAKLQTLLKTGLNKGQGLIIPDKALDTDDFKIPQFSTLNPLDWRKEWKSEAIKDLGMPELHLGSADGTNDASAKMVYFQFEQPVADEQDELEQQLLIQLKITLTLIKPLSIEDNEKEQSSKDGNIIGEKKSETATTTIKKEDKNPSNSSVKKKL